MSWLCLADFKKNILKLKMMDELITINEKVEEVYKILTHRKIRKAWPTNPQIVKDVIKYRLENKMPLVLVTNWLGVKITEKGVADKVDKAVLLNIKINIVDKLAKIGIASKIKILFTDINASYLEGFKKDRIDLYWNTLKPIVESFGDNFQLIRVNSELWNNLFKLDGNETLSLDEIAKATGDEDILNEVKKIAEEIIKKPIFQQFVSRAEKYSLFVKNKILTAEEVAKRYLYFRIFARRRYKKMFPNEIYFYYDKPETQVTEFIEYPTIYIFSIYKGFSDCPWFIDENDERFKRLVQMGKIVV